MVVKSNFITYFYPLSCCEKISFVLFKNERQVFNLSITYNLYNSDTNRMIVYKMLVYYYICETKVTGLCQVCLFVIFNFVVFLIIKWHVT